MTKIIEIDCCGDCKHYSDIRDTCDYPSQDRRTLTGIPHSEFPSWYPLPDKVEVKKL